MTQEADVELAVAVINEVRAENERLKKWVSDLQSGFYINCVYCGHRYGPASTTEPTMQEVLKKHVEGCEKHPLNALAKRYGVVATFARLQLPGYLEAARRDHGRFNPQGKTEHAGHSFDTCPAHDCALARGVAAELTQALDP